MALEDRSVALGDPKVRDRIAWSLWAVEYNDDYHSWTYASKAMWYRRADFILGQLRKIAGAT